ncbi:alpha/beta fold hydrolase [Stieleria sp. TO1_6]|nr:alpha/beta fold hydrolase [Stieleria tagensis]
MPDQNAPEFAIDHFGWLDPFVPNRWWRGGWLQTVSIKTLRPELTPDNWPGAQPFNVPDQNTPPDVLCGYYFPTRQPTDRPATILFHGMGGHALSGYMRSMAEHLLDAGYPVILWNNRGAGRSASKCTGLHHPGNVDDVKLLLRHLTTEHPQWVQSGITAVAFSLGANPLLCYLAESGDESQFSATVSVSAPLDMELTSRNLRRGMNRVFDRYLLHRQQKELLRESADLSARERSIIDNVSSVWQLDDQFTAKRYGFESAADYYRAHSAVHVLSQIRTPTLLFHASDDPVVDDAPFLDRDWQPGGPLYPAFSESGGHTGFLDRRGGRWHENAAAKFFDAMIDGIKRPTQ